MKKAMLALPLALAMVSCRSINHESPESNNTDQRLNQLETRVAKLEAMVKPVDAADRMKEIVDGQRLKARERMRMDAELYSRKQLREIESLYQVANKKWRSQEGKDSLKKLIDKFDKANRTGCALLYLGQMSEGEEREEYLKKAIEGFSDCYYGDGVQVGSYARHQLAWYYKNNNEPEKADKLFKEIKEKYPDAIDHKGNLLNP